MTEESIFTHSAAIARDPVALVAAWPLKFTCEIYALEVEGNFILRLELLETESSSEDAGLYLSRGTFNLLTVPASTFPDEKKRAEWIDKTVAVFRRSLVDVMADEARLRFNDAANFHLGRMGLDRVSEKYIIETHLKETAARVRRYLGKGLRSQWNKHELEQAIRGALATAQKQKRNYAGVVEALKQTHPHKAPPTVAALKALVSRHQVDWKGLKSNTQQESNTE